jgi:hypothetical protein
MTACDGSTRRAWLAACMVAGLLVCGCSSRGRGLVPVRGRATLDGAPLAWKGVFFHPEPGTPGLGSSGVTQADGSFELLAGVGGALETFKGAMPGEYRVTVEEPAYDYAGESGQPVVRARIPAVYTQRQTTPLRVTIGDENDTVEIRLDSKAK